jgi:FMN phosphatase YigB (HAD superfamily)
MNKINLYIFDIDGVVADISHRLRYMHEKNYDAFYSDEELAKDEEIPAGIDLVNRLFESDNSFVMFMTGRPYSTQKATWKWLNEHKVKHCRSGFFRDDGDYRPSPIVKVEGVKQAIAEVKNILDKASKDGSFGEMELGKVYFIDDDPKNVQAIEEAYPEITGLVFTTERMEKQA